MNKETLTSHSGGLLTGHISVSTHKNTLYMDLSSDFEGSGL